jgi:hypothetical protein
LPGCMVVGGASFIPFLSMRPDAWLASNKQIAPYMFHVLGYPTFVDLFVFTVIFYCLVFALIKKEKIVVKDIIATVLRNSPAILLLALLFNLLDFPRLLPFEPVWPSQ